MVRFAAELLYPRGKNLIAGVDDVERRKILALPGLELPL
jgi:hypothetical protein